MKIIIDTDIGDDIDDAFAIRLALNTPQLEILGITTTFRNAVKRGKIVKALLAACGKDLPVYAGEDRPVKQEICKLTYEDEIGLDDDGTVTVPHYSEEFKNYEIESGGVEFILEQAAKYPGEVVLVCIGPLTNAARAIGKDAETFKKLKGLVMMGGQANGDYAEWNFRCDPEAAQITFASDIPIRMVGINVTKYCKLTEREIALAAGDKSAAGKMLNKMLQKWLKENRYRKEPVMHDGLAVAELTESFCEYVTRPVGVSTEEGKRGMLCAGGNPAQIAVSVQAEKFIGYLFDRLRRNV